MQFKNPTTAKTNIWANIFQLLRHQSTHLKFEYKHGGTFQPRAWSVTTDIRTNLPLFSTQIMYDFSICRIACGIGNCLTVILNLLSTVVTNVPCAITIRSDECKINWIKYFTFCHTQLFYAFRMICTINSDYFQKYCFVFILETLFAVR